MAGLRDRYRQFKAYIYQPWWATAYLLDWEIIAIVHTCTKWVQMYAPFEHTIEDRLNDESISKSMHTGKVQVNGRLLFNLTFVLPFVVIVLISYARRSWHVMHHASLALLGSYRLSEFVSESIKNRTGKFRPDFLDRCQWDYALRECTGSAKKILDGRKAFPSWHSTSSGAGLGMLALFIAGQLGAFALTAEFPSSALIQSRIFRLLCALTPILLGVWICITRLEDHMHFAIDVVFGYLLGFSFALALYHILFPSPFVADNLSIMHIPKQVYKNAEHADGPSPIRLDEESA